MSKEVKNNPLWGSESKLVAALAVAGLIGSSVLTLPISVPMMVMASVAAGGVAGLLTFGAIVACEDIVKGIGSLLQGKPEEKSVISGIEGHHASRWSHDSWFDIPEPEGTVVEPPPFPRHDRSL